MIVLLFMRLLVVGLSLADSFATRRTRKGNFLNQIDQLIDWAPIEETIAQYYTPVSDATDRPAYLSDDSDESVEDMANANLHVMRFLGLDLEDDVRDSFGTFPFQDTPDGYPSLGRLAGTDQPANTGTPDNSNKRLSHRCEHYAQPAQAPDKTGV